MSVRSGRETKRHPLEVYKGFRIIKTEHITYHRSLWDNTRFDKNWIDSRDIYFNFCKEGEEKYPSKDYQIGVKTISECKEAIDKLLNGEDNGNGDIFYTHEEYQKYIKKPNEKCDYGYGYESLMKIMRQHQKADKRMQWFLEERLHDANFHTEGDILSTCDYEVFEDYCAQTNKFKEKFEVCTKTLRKCIKDPQTLVEGMNKAIADYLASQGIKDTSVEVKYCEVW
jgi:hypothetical protein